jgi:hypothetical protein
MSLSGLSGLPHEPAESPPQAPPRVAPSASLPTDSGTAGSAHNGDVKEQASSPGTLPLTEESVALQLRAIREESSSLESSRPQQQLRLLMDALSECTVSVHGMGLPRRLLSTAQKQGRQPRAQLTLTCDVQDRCASLARNPGAQTQLEKRVYTHHLKAGAFSKSLKDMQVAQQTTLGLILTGCLVNQLLPGGPAHLAGLRKGDTILEVPHQCISLPRSQRYIRCNVHSTDCQIASFAFMTMNTVSCRRWTALAHAS